MSDKLPEWPDYAEYRDPVNPVHFKSVTYASIYYEALSAAALARMEALVECLKGIRADRGYMAISGRAHEIDYLLAACERRK